ncbi:MAG: prepilin-type N-terminal cleavage/methylation domain-containing protein [Patescibacteria group bacterium]
MVKKGFTLIELLVVISIIALLSSIVLASLSKAREKALYTTVVAELSSVEKALYLLYEDRGGCYPRENNATCGGYATVGNPTLATLIASSTFGLSKYLRAAPKWPFNADEWQYDNEGDSVIVPEACTTVSARGLNLFIQSATPEQYRTLNTLIDRDADPDTDAARSCGKIWFSGTATVAGSLYYNAVKTQ